jgi:hypothetical protein
MNNFQEEQQLIHDRIAYELIGIVPETWNVAILQVQYFEDNGIESYSHTIKNLEGSNILAFSSDALFLATRELSILFKKHRSQWRKAIYIISLTPDGDWDYKADFEY